jgi:putative ATPase
MKDLGYGREYRYAHDEAGAYAAGENYFPEHLSPEPFYEPVERGLEAKIRERLEGLRSLDREAKRKRREDGGS